MIQAIMKEKKMCACAKTLKIHDKKISIKNDNLCGKIKVLHNFISYGQPSFLFCVQNT
jgi:hypothetical protein